MIAAIVQARMGSTRLPGKVLKNICGKPLIWHVINRLKPSHKIAKIILAMTDNPADDILEKWAIENQVIYYRGNENNVLDRFYQVAKKFQVDIIVRITADDPFKDYYIMDQVIDLFERENLDFAYNNRPTTFPEGLDVEVFSFRLLELAKFKASNNFEREHVTPYFYQNLFLFKHNCLTNPKNLSYLRWTIDTQDDFEMATIVYNKLFTNKNIFLMPDIIDLLEKNPEIAKINCNVPRSTMYINSLN